MKKQKREQAKKIRVVEDKQLATVKGGGDAHAEVMNNPLG